MTNTELHHICHRDKLNWDKQWNLMTLCQECHLLADNKKAFLEKYPQFATRIEIAGQLNNRLIQMEEKKIRVEDRNGYYVIIQTAEPNPYFSEFAYNVMPEDLIEKLDGILNDEV